MWIKAQKRFAAEGMADRSGKPGTKRSETQLGEDLQRIAATNADGITNADSPNNQSESMPLQYNTPMQ